MRIIKTALLFALALFLTVVACDWFGSEPKPEGDQGDYGEPNHILIRSLPDSQTNVAFGLIGDTHIDATSCAWFPWGGGHPYRDTDHVKRNRHTIYSLNIHLDETPNCHGTVHLGDMVNANNTQNLVAFRQLYECDYPGHDGGAIAGARDDDYNAYSQGARVNKTVFPTVGNHDTPYYGDDPKDWYEPASYIRDCVKGADGIVSYFDNNSGAYAWRWGQYYFIQLGLWAGSGRSEDKSYISFGKLHWLEDFLAEHVGNSGLGVLIFQHYGWDWFSKKDNKWWNSVMRSVELDVLCRRDWCNPGGEPARPYNVLGIFSGHCHDVQHIRVFAGLDAQGDSVHFDNITVDDAGAETDYGYSIVELLGAEMKISTMNISHGPKYRWTYWTKPYHLGP